MKNRRILLAGLAAVGIAGGAWWWLAAGAAPETPVRTVAVTRGNLETTVTALGTVEPLRYVDVGAQISGQIDTLSVALGDRVAAGDPLVVIDPTVYEATVKADRATLKSLEAQRREQQARLVLARQEHQRNLGLYKANAVAKEEVDATAADVAIAEAQLDQLAAQIENAQSTLEADEANLSYTRVTAPMDGTVISLDVSEGQTISARQDTPVLMRIADLDTMTVNAQVSEADVGKLTVGMTAWFTTLGEPDRKWEGTLRQIQPTPEEVNDVILYTAQFDVSNADRRLLPQMTAQVFFLLGRATNVPLVPVSVLRGSGSDRRVSIVAKDGSVTERTVTIGLQDRVNAEVVRGLDPGERVALQMAKPTAEQRRGPWPGP